MLIGRSRLSAAVLDAMCPLPWQLNAQKNIKLEKYFNFEEALGMIDASLSAFFLLSKKMYERLTHYACYSYFIYKVNIIITVVSGPEHSIEATTENG